MVPGAMLCVGCAPGGAGCAAGCAGCIGAARGEGVGCDGYAGGGALAGTAAAGAGFWLFMRLAAIGEIGAGGAASSTAATSSRSMVRANGSGAAGATLLFACGAGATE